MDDFDRSAINEIAGFIDNELNSLESFCIQGNWYDHWATNPDTGVVRLTVKDRKYQIRVTREKSPSSP